MFTLQQGRAYSVHVHPAVLVLTTVYYKSVMFDSVKNVYIIVRGPLIKCILSSGVLSVHIFNYIKVDPCCSTYHDKRNF